MTIDKILEDYEGLERDDIFAVLVYATQLTQVKHIKNINLAA